MAQHGFKFPVIAIVALAAMLPAATPETARAATLHTPTGIRATVHSVADIKDHWIVERDGRTFLEHPTAGTVELDTATYPWGDLAPVDQDVVADALEAMHGFYCDLAVDVFVLPGFPAGVMSSFARNDAVFLAPGLGPQAPSTVSYVVTHEMGHVLCWAALDGRPARWDAYRDLRGLDPAGLDGADVPHAQRHREIIAEDIRFLFGGPAATASGTIENGDLPTPDTVAGLAELLSGFIAEPGGSTVVENPTRVYPNPCRDAARVDLDLGDVAAKSGITGPTTLEIFDVRGRLVRRVTDERVTAGRASVTWDGTGQDGRRAAAGLYLYRIANGTQTGSGRVVLLSR